MANLDKTVVLVADDEPSTLALVTSHLRSRGYKVLEAVDGDQAWELAHEHLPHVVVLDVMMPGMSGWEVCRKIREAVSLAHTGVVMLTGIGETLNEMTSPLYGADAYIDKPFEFSDLDRKIKETVSRRRAGAIGRPDHADVETIVGGSLPDTEGGTKPGVGGALPKPAPSALDRLPPVEVPRPPPPPRRAKAGAQLGGGSSPGPAKASPRTPKSAAPPARRQTQRPKPSAPAKRPAKRRAAAKAVKKASNKRKPARVARVAPKKSAKSKAKTKKPSRPKARAKLKGRRKA